VQWCEPAEFRIRRLKAYDQAAQLNPDEVAHVEPVVACDPFMQLANLEQLQATRRLWLDRASVDAHECRDDRDVLATEVEARRVEVEQAVLASCLHDLLVHRTEVCQRQQPQRYRRFLIARAAA
jgi:hypothetical protein